MKYIKTTNKYISNELMLEYFDKRYNLLEGIYSANTKQSMAKIRKGSNRKAERNEVELHVYAPL